MKMLMRVVAWMVVGLLVALATTLGAAFLSFTNLPWPWARTVLAVAFVLAAIALFVLLRPRWKAVVGFAVLFGLVVLWYDLVAPSNDRAWTPDVAQVATADIVGDRLVLHNVRNFHYRARDDYDERWETREYDLSRLRTLDLTVTYWGPTDIAHTMLSFGFEGDAYLCLSVETRKEVGEVYSPIASFFKRFELIYVFADERDLLALRTNHRQEDSYLFPMQRDVTMIRALLLDILDRANAIAERPVFYGTIADNCTTSLARHFRNVEPERFRFDLRLLLNGYLPEVAYERGQIETDAPFEVVKQRYAISAAARERPVDETYSRRIRAARDAQLQPAP